jgi:hypothetical protein
MAYRDSGAARLEERRMLVGEIERLDAERSRLQSNLRRRDELARRLRELDLFAGLPPEEQSELFGLRRKSRLGLVAAAIAAAGAAAGASVQAQDTESTRSLLLLVKYVDRVGTQVQQRIDLSDSHAEDSYPETSDPPRAGARSWE